MDAIKNQLICPLQRNETKMNLCNKMSFQASRLHGLALLLLSFVLLSKTELLLADEPVEKAKTGEKLELVQTVFDPSLKKCSFVEMGPDGKHVYATSWSTGSIVVFDRNQETGSLKQIQVVKTPELAGVTDLKITSNGIFAVASCFRAKAAVLFERNPATGKLNQLDVEKEDEFGPNGIYWAIDIGLSPDGRFVYVADDRSPGRGSKEPKGYDGRILALKLYENGILDPIQTYLGEKECFNGIRSVCSHPDGKTLFAACWRPGTLVVVNRDVDSGTLSVRQILSKEEKGLEVLNGAMTVVCSSDGKFVYTSSGMFSERSNSLKNNVIGSNGRIYTDVPQGVGVFRITKEGKLTTEQTILTGGEGQLDLRGCNQLLVTADGKRVYVSGSASSTIGCFARNKTTGKLVHEQTLKYDVDKLPGIKQANGFAESQDGQFLYVTGEGSGAVSVFKRVSQ